MALAILKRPPSGVILVFSLFVLLFIALYFMSAVTQSSEQFGRLYYLLLVISAIGLIALVALISVNLLRLVRQYQLGIAGSRLTVRLVIMFVILSVLPVSVVFYFSIGFLHRGAASIAGLTSALSRPSRMRSN